MHKVSIPLAAAVAVSGFVAPALAAGGATVKVADYKFAAKTIHIKKGQTVTWKWVGDDAHNVTFHGFHSKTQDTGKYKHRFAKAGTYKYVCTIHAKSFAMHGTVIVK